MLVHAWSGASSAERNGSVAEFHCGYHSKRLLIGKSEMRVGGTALCFLVVNLLGPLSRLAPGMDLALGGM